MEQLWLYEDQIRSLASNSFCLAIYLVAIFVFKVKNLYAPVVMVIICQSFTLSPLYSYMANDHTYLCEMVNGSDQYCETKQAEVDYASMSFIVLSFIYFTGVTKMAYNYKIMKWCFIMAVFELIVYKAYRDEIGIVFIEAFLYENYELLVTLLHMAIINSAINWRKVIGSVRDYCLPLLRTIRNVSLSLPY